MKRTFLIFLLAAAAAGAQTTAKPATPAGTASKAAAPAGTAAKPVSHASTSLVKLPPGVPPVRGPVVTAFTLRYQDIKLGTGADAAPRKMVKVHYTGWLAAGGRKFDSSYDHPGSPVTGKDGQYVRDANGKIQTGGPQPISFPLGMGRVIPGFDAGFIGMKVGGKRRIFIPWQLAYGALGRPGPDPAHPGIPPKADLIFDVELIDMTDLAMPPNHPGMGDMHAMPQPQVHPAAPPAQPSAPAQSAPATPPVPPPATSSPAQPATPGQPQPH